MWFNNIVLFFQVKCSQLEDGNPERLSTPIQSSCQGRRPLLFLLFLQQMRSWHDRTLPSTLSSFTRTLFLKYLDSSFKCQTRCLCSIAKLTSFISLPFSRCRESVVPSGQNLRPFHLLQHTHQCSHRLNVLQPHWGQLWHGRTTKSNRRHPQIRYTSVISMLVARSDHFVVSSKRWPAIDAEGYNAFVLSFCVIGLIGKQNWNIHARNDCK